MRSFAFTILLLLITVGVASIGVMRLREGSLEKLLGTSATTVGEYLYELETDQIHRIVLTGNGVKASAVFEDGIWRLEQPWHDRMDPRFAAAILQFTIGTRVADIIPEGKIDTAKADLTEGTIGIMIQDKDGGRLARYRLGRKTEWIHRDEKTEEETPTVFVQPLDDGREGFVYACTGDIHGIFKDGFRYLRDHHPFLFNPRGLETMRIQDSESEVLLARTDNLNSSNSQTWRITKPMDLRTDPDAVRKLIEDLFKLTAVRVSDRAEVTLPADGVTGLQRIALRHFGQKDEVVLEIFPPVAADSETVLATVSDRPGTVFELQLKPLAPRLSENGSPSDLESSSGDIVSLAGLPDTVNELRNPMLTNIRVDALEGVMIKSATSSDILLAREAGQPWLYLNQDKMEPINDVAMFRLLKAVTQRKVAGFVTDAAVDLEPYGLDRPSVSLRFLFQGNDTLAGKEGETIDLQFGQSREGIWYAMRVGIPTVMRLDDQFIFEIYTRPWQWRHPSVWSISPVDLVGFERVIEGAAPLSLEYDFLTEEWKAREGGVDRSIELVTNRADRLLKLLLNIQCESWLAPDDSSALKALANPVLRFKLAVKIYDGQGGFLGIVDRELVLAPESDSVQNRAFYGRIDSDPHAFLLGTETVRLLAADLFGDN